MSYTINISRVINFEQVEVVEGCEFDGGHKAIIEFNDLEKRYRVEPNYKDDYLVNLYQEDDKICSFATNEENAHLIDDEYFKH